MLQEDFYTIVTKDIEITNSKNKHIFFTFKEENEANNFLNYLKTDFCRFCLSIYKNNSQLDRGELASIPWLNFKEEWSDDKLYSFFNISDDERNFIEKFIVKYY